jgi:hypothetical protein
MPPLRLPRREKFAKLLATGMRKTKAYTQAGFGGKPERRSELARRLSNEQEIRERVAELTQTTVGHIKGAALPLAEAHDPGASQRRGMHEDVLAATMRDDEAKPLGKVVPVHRAQFIDFSVGLQICRSLRSRAPGRICNGRLSDQIAVAQPGRWEPRNLPRRRPSQ